MFYIIFFLKHNILSKATNWKPSNISGRMGTTGSTVIAVESRLQIPENFPNSTDVLILPSYLYTVDLEKNTISQNTKEGFLVINKSSIINSTPEEKKFQGDSYEMRNVTSCNFYPHKTNSKIDFDNYDFKILTDIWIALNTFKNHEVNIKKFLNPIPSKTERYKFCTRCNRRRSQ